MTYIIYLVSGILSGILSALGIGGGIILIPILTEFMNYSQIEAQLTNLIYFLPTALTSIYIHNKSGLINKGEVRSIIPFSILGTILGTILSLLLLTTVLTKLFGLFLIIAGTKQFFKIKGENDEYK